jgi:hypothetical protein
MILATIAGGQNQRTERVANRDRRRRRLICANFDRDPASELIVD